MTDLRDMFTREFWDERYSSSHRIWSGKPNLRLVDQVEALAPGTALDVGCGEGADAVWLAGRGWTVTGVDVSGVALERAAEHAHEAGVGERTSWLRADVFAGDPLPGGFDLVSAAYVHVPPEDFEAVYTALAGSVAPGGSLVVLAHHPDDVHTGLRNTELSHLLFGPDAVTSLLDPAVWEVVAAETPTRPITHEGRDIDVTDTVVRAVRRA
ncbi:class I SAM-dependent methyltransferase [Nocardioides sp. 1609]|uniref:class I SAM-dependent methyltransferase n=1 Tax=Nocardioides sp. 1609 TaxID=2508327 RepID=UPI00106F2ABB|nr:class I SAM-dependent methyltransferase [Nocardioides sp. 1609]